MNKITTHLRLATTAISIALLSIGTAHAEDSGQGGFASLIPLVLIMVIFYFLLIRPQQKRVKEHKGVIEALKKGDKVITGGGFHGKLTDIKDDTVKVEIADGVRVTVQRDTIVGLAD